MNDPIYEQRKQALIAEISAVFDGVERGDGVTWGEAWVIDDCGSAEERAEARKEDAETRWQHLHDYKISRGDAVLSFLDARGFYYYLPAYLVWYLKFVDSDDLEVGSNTFGSVISHLSRDFAVSAEENGLSPFDLMTPEQNRAVANFLSFEAERTEYWNGEEVKDWAQEMKQDGGSEEEIKVALADQVLPNDAQIALERYWGQFL